MKVERKIASRETTNVRNWNGYGSKRMAWGTPGRKCQNIHPPNQATCTEPEAILPQKWVIASAMRSAGERLAALVASSWAISSILRCVSASRDSGVGGDASRG